MKSGPSVKQYFSSKPIAYDISACASYKKLRMHLPQLHSLDEVTHLTHASLVQMEKIVAPCGKCQRQECRDPPHLFVPQKLWAGVRTHSILLQPSSLVCLWATGGLFNNVSAKTRPARLFSAVHATTNRSIIARRAPQIQLCLPPLVFSITWSMLGSCDLLYNGRHGTIQYMNAMR